MTVGEKNNLKGGRIGNGSKCAHNISLPRDGADEYRMHSTGRKECNINQSFSQNSHIFISLTRRPMEF